MVVNKPVCVCVAVCVRVCVCVWSVCKGEYKNVLLQYILETNPHSRDAWIEFPFRPQHERVLPYKIYFQYILDYIGKNVIYLLKCLLKLKKKWRCYVRMNSSQSLFCI